MAESSFDIVSKVDLQELDNAVTQTSMELSKRFDFRNTGAAIERTGKDAISLSADSEGRVVAALDVLKDKLVRRGISLKALDAGEPRLSGKTYKIACQIVQGISTEKAKVISKLIRDEGPKGVHAQVQGDQLRVSSKKKDDLQKVIAMLKQADFDVPLQFVNYR